MRPLLLVALLVVAARPAAGQTCLGNNSFTSGWAQAALSASASGRAESLGGSLAVGLPQGEFIGATMTVSDVADVEPHAKAIGAFAGHAFALGSSQRVELCPLITASYLSMAGYRESGFTSDVDAVTVGIGAALGMLAFRTDRVGIAPSLGAALRVRRSTLEVHDAANWTLDRSTRDLYGQVDVGIGIVLADRVSLQPSVVFPIGLEQGEPGYGIALGLSFGRPARGPRIP